LQAEQAPARPPTAVCQQGTASKSRIERSRQSASCNGTLRTTDTACHQAAPSGNAAYSNQGAQEEAEDRHRQRVGSAEKPLQRRGLAPQGGVVPQHTGGTASVWCCVSHQYILSGWELFQPHSQSITAVKSYADNEQRPRPFVQPMQGESPHTTKLEQLANLPRPP
jgi:hypothetical protein